MQLQLGYENWDQYRNQERIPKEKPNKYIIGVIDPQTESDERVPLDQTEDSTDDSNKRNQHERAPEKGLNSIEIQRFGTGRHKISFCPLYSSHYCYFFFVLIRGSNADLETHELQTHRKIRRHVSGMSFGDNANGNLGQPPNKTCLRCGRKTGYPEKAFGDWFYPKEQNYYFL